MIHCFVRYFVPFFVREHRGEDGVEVAGVHADAVSSDAFLVAKDQRLPQRRVFVPQRRGHFLIEAVIEQYQFLSAIVQSNQKIGGVRIAMHLAKEEDHLVESERHQLRQPPQIHIPSLELLDIGDGNAFDILHRENACSAQIGIHDGNRHSVLQKLHGSCQREGMGRACLLREKLSN